jgi:hypothetical protein
MSPSLPLQNDDVSYAAAANDARHPTLSFSDRIGESRRSSRTTPTRRLDSNPNSTIASRTPDNGRMWTPLVHISGGSNKSGHGAVSQSSGLQLKAAMTQMSSNAIEGLNDGVNDSPNLSHTVPQSTIGTPPCYPDTHDIADDGKTLACNRTLTFDTFVAEAQLGNDIPLEKAKRCRRDLFRSWIKTRAERLHLIRKP